MRHVHDHQTVDEFWLAHSQDPGQRGAPIVSDEQSFFGIGGLDQRGDVFDQGFGAVGGNFLGRIGGAVTSEIRRPDAVTDSGEQRHLVPPGNRVLGKTVQAEREAIARAHGGDFERDSIR